MLNAYHVRDSFDRVFGVETSTRLVFYDAVFLESFDPLLHVDVERVLIQ